MENRDELPRLGNQRLNQGLRRVHYAQHEMSVQQILAQSRHLRHDVMKNNGERYVRTPTPMPPPNHPLAQSAAQALAAAHTGAPALPSLNQEEIQTFYLRSLTQKAENKSANDDDLLLFDDSGSEDGDITSRYSSTFPAKAHEGPRGSNSRFGRLMEAGSPRVASPWISTSVNALDEGSSKHSISIGLGNKSLASYMKNRPDARRSSSMDLRDTAMTPKANYEDFCAATDRLSQRSKISSEDDLEVISLDRASPCPITGQDLGISDASIGRSARLRSPHANEKDLAASITSTQSKTRSVTDEDLDLEVISLGRITMGSKTSNKNRATESSQGPQLETSTSSTSAKTQQIADVIKETGCNPPIGQSNSAWTAPSTMSVLKKRISRVFSQITRPFRSCLHPSTKE